MLELQSLFKSYRGIPAIQDVNFRIASGEIVGFLGSNVAGKSTTVKIITGLLRPNDGKVLFEGQDIRKDMVTFRRALGYPIAYLRRVRQLVIGPGTHAARSWVARPLHGVTNAMLARRTVRRAVFHFISETLLRVQRYRIYLVLYGGGGLSVVTAAILSLAVVHKQIRADVSSNGIRAAVGIVAFWTIAGLRMAFVSPGNRQGSWVFHSIHGRAGTVPDSNGSVAGRENLGVSLGADH